MTTTMTAESAIGQVQNQAEQIKSTVPQRFSEAAQPGEAFRQGDVYIELLDRVPGGATRMKTPTLQLAEGDTQGSRHTLDSASGVEMFTRKDPSAFDGPVFRVSEERTVTHPEHGHVTLPANQGEQCYGVRFQRNLDAQEREEKVRD